MTNHSVKAKQSTSNASFNMYVDLFDKGEFYEMSVTRQSDKYHVDLDNMYLGTLSKNSENCWEVVSGTIPSTIMPDITNNIIRNFEIN